MLESARGVLSAKKAAAPRALPAHHPSPTYAPPELLATEDAFEGGEGGVPAPPPPPPHLCRAVGLDRGRWVVGACLWTRWDPLRSIDDWAW